MRVKLTRSLGRLRADKLGMDCREVAENTEHELNRPDALELIAAGLAVDVTPPEARTPKAEPKPEPKAEAKPEPPKEETKPAAKPSYKRGK